jgi:hypothetical protein
MRASRWDFVSPGTEETGCSGSAAGAAVGITVGVMALGSAFVEAAWVNETAKRNDKRIIAFMEIG